MTVNLSGWGVATTAQGFTGAPNGIYTVTAAYSGDTNFNPVSATTSIDVVSGGSQGFTYVYDRYGNRWQQNVTAGSGPAPQYSFNAATNQISGGVAYDAAGNVTNDGYHLNSYDAEGNISSVDNGSTAQYTYDALNERVQTLIGSYKTEYLFNRGGQRLSVWNGTNNTLYRSQYYWGSTPISFYNGQTYFQHQDWLGTERMRTGYNGSVAATFTSLPFGDALTTTLGSDVDGYHFAGLDRDIETGSDHAQFRQYTSTQGRWMSPDPYGGSYDFTNPESFNRYAYAFDNPLSYTDVLGLETHCVTDKDGTTTCFDDGKGGDPCNTDFSVCVYDPGPIGPGGGGWGWNPGTSGFRPPHGPPRAPNRGYTDFKPLFCTGDALRSNGVALGLDAAGFIPGEGFVAGFVQMGISGAAAVNAGYHGDNFGGNLGIFGMPIPLAAAALKEGGASFAKAVPFVGWVVNGIASGHDLKSTYHDYQTCMSSNKYD